MATLEEALGADQTLPPEILNASTEEISNRTKLLENDIKIMKSDQMRISHEQVKV
jgi:26S proteasome regulatory subunit T5